MDTDTNWYCYILDNEIDNATYNGKTNDLTRRLNEHNGKKKRGARHTRKFGRNDEGEGTWKYVAIVSGLPDESHAYKCEWRIKKPEGKTRKNKFSKGAGRVKGLVHGMLLEQFTSNCTIKTKDMNLTIHVRNEYLELLEKLEKLDHITIKGYNIIPYEEL